MTIYFIKVARNPRRAYAGVYNGGFLVVAEVKLTDVSNVLSGGGDLYILVEVNKFLVVGALLFFS